MALTTEKELSPKSHELWLKARHAQEIGNHGFVLVLLAPVLKESPGFLDGRKLMRKAAFAQTKGKKSGFSGISTLGLSGAGTLKKDPLAAMELAERTLATDPANVQANRLLRDAANEAGFPETAAFAMETVVVANPKDTKLLHELGEQYNRMGDSDKAVAIYSKIVELNPADQEAVKKSKDAAANATMKKGGWAEVGASGGTKNFRDLLNKKDEALALENKGKIVRTAEQITQQLGEVYAIWEQDRTAIDPSRRLANLYEQLFDVVSLTNDQEAEGHLDSAIWYYDHTNTEGRGGDPAVARKLTDLRARKVDRHIKALETWLAQVSQDHPDAARCTEELNTLKLQRDSAVIETARKRVADNPTDLQLRFELGEVLFKAGQFTDAIPELQRAKQNPNARLKSMNLLGQCFVEKGMLDLAVSQFKTAASEILAMDATKKEILYKLGLVHERMGNKEDYITCMKEIYEADYGYLDVAKRVESSYGG